MIINVILICCACLCFLSGIMILAGTESKRRKHVVWFSLATLSSSLWCLSIYGFRNMQEINFATNIYIWGIYGFAILTDVVIFRYVADRIKYVELFTIIMSICGVVLIGYIISEPTLLYTGITLNNDGNALVMQTNWFYNNYVVFFVISTLFILIYLLMNIAKESVKLKRYGKIFLLVGLSITSILSLIFNLILPPTNYSLIWVGPMSISVVIIASYFAIMKYQISKLSIFWLKRLSRFIIILSCGAAYGVIMYWLFNALIGDHSDTADVWKTLFFSNIILLVVIVMAMPLIKIFFKRINNLIPAHTIDYEYVKKKIKSYINMDGASTREMSIFLASYLHLTYIGFIVNGELVGSSPVSLSTEDIDYISGLGAAEEGVWQRMNGTMTKNLYEIGIARVAELRDEKGLVFGQVLVGRNIDDSDIAETSERLKQISDIIKLAAKAINK